MNRLDDEGAKEKEVTRREERIKSVTGRKNIFEKSDFFVVVRLMPAGEVKMWSN